MAVNETGTITLRLMAQDLASGNIGKFIGHMDAMAKKGGLMGSVMQGVGQSFGQMLNPMALASRGIGMVTDFLMDATKAAAEDEKSQAQLTQTLVNNVPDWQRYAGAIEQATETALGLAFADDEVRGSLNLLLPRTKDVNEALRLNALAMDLARFKGLSLEEAATLVGKAYSGQVSALKRAGVAITETKDSTKALAQLQEMVAGQASTYANTAEGSYKTLQLTIDELVEQIGYELLPTLKDFASYVRTDVIPNIDNMVHGLQDAAQWAALSSGIIRGDLTSALVAFGQLTDTEMKTFTVPAPGAVQFFDPIPKAAEEAADETASVFRRYPRIISHAVVDMKQAIKDGKAGIIEQFRDLAWQTKHPFAEVRYEDWLQKRQRKAQNKMEAAAKAGRPGVVEQYRQLVFDIQTELNGLPGYAQRIHDAVMASLAGAGGIGSGINTPAYPDETLGGVGDFGGGGGKWRKGKDGKWHKRAAGGPVSAGQTYLVGEQGPELLHMGRGGGNGTIIPNHAIGGSTVNVNITVQTLAFPSEAEGARLARQWVPHIRREMARAGA